MWHANHNRRWQQRQQWLRGCGWTLGDSDSFTSRGFRVYVAAERKSFELKIHRLQGSARDVCRIDHHFVLFFFLFQWNTHQPKGLFFSCLPKVHLTFLKGEHTHSGFRRVMWPRVSAVSGGESKWRERGWNWWHSPLSHWVTRTHGWITNFPFRSGKNGEELHNMSLTEFCSRSDPVMKNLAFFIFCVWFSWQSEKKTLPGNNFGSIFLSR